MDEWILETTRPHKHVTIFGIFFVNFFLQNKTGIKTIFFQHTSTMGNFNYKQEKRNFPHIIQYAPIKWFQLFKIVDKWISVWTSGLQKSLVHLPSHSKSLTKPLASGSGFSMSLEYEKTVRPKRAVFFTCHFYTAGKELQGFLQRALQIDPGVPRKKPRSWLTNGRRISNSSSSNRISLTMW